MAIIHRVRLFEPKLDRVSTLLRFLSDNARAAALRHEHPGVVNRKLRTIDTPADFPVRLEDINGASD